MELLGTHVPISWSTLIVLMCGVLLSRPVSRWLSVSLGWRRGATGVAWVAFSAVLALTVPPDGSGPADPDHCLPDYVTQVWSEPLHTSGGIGGGLLNVLLFLPLGTALVVAARRVRAAIPMVFTFPAIVEIVQRWVPGRLCSYSDYLTNTAGGLVGVVLGALLLVRRPSLSTTELTVTARS